MNVINNKFAKKKVKNRKITNNFGQNGQNDADPTPDPAPAK